MKIETREKFPNFVGFVSGVDLKKELNDEVVQVIDDAINKLKQKLLFAHLALFGATSATRIQIAKISGRSDPESSGKGVGGCRRRRADLSAGRARRQGSRHKFGGARRSHDGFPSWLFVSWGRCEEVRVRWGRPTREGEHAEPASRGEGEATEFYRAAREGAVGR